MKGNLIKILAVGGCAALLTTQALAETKDGYFGISYTSLNYEESGFPDANLSALNLRIGKQYDEVISGELRFGFGVQDDEVSVFGYDAQLSVDTLLGVYLRASVPVEGNFKPYAIVGFNRAELEVNILGNNVSASEDDVAYGLGFDVEISNNLDLNVEYANLYDKDGTELRGLNISLSARY